MADRFERTKMLLGEEAMARLASARVAVFGLGGVGGYAAEALARSGIGALDLVDHDRVSETNLNRQILALESTIGMFKTDVAAARIKEINPACLVTTYQVFYLPDTADQFDFSAYDYIIDAIDTVTGKLLLAERAKQSKTPIISSLGTGNKLDPTLLQVGDLYETEFCPLARIMRRECRKRDITSLKVVYSKEPPLRPGESEEDPGARRSIPGSAVFVPASAGLLLASQVVKDLITE